MTEITIVIPCYNEADSLPELIEEIRKCNVKFAFVLVDNGSTDATQRVLKDLSIPKCVRLLKKKENTGYGGGIKFGLKQVNTEFSGWMHADLQQNISVLLNANILIEELINSKLQGLNAFKGLRTKRSVIENIFTIGVSLVASVLFFRSCWDIAGQPNIFRTSDLVFLEKSPDNHNFEFYIYLKFLLLGGKFHRFEAPFFKRRFGSSSWDQGLLSKLNHAKNIFKYLVYLRFSAND